MRGRLRRGERGLRGETHLFIGLVANRLELRAGGGPLLQQPGGEAGQRIALGAAAAPLFVTGLVTFLILFGMGIAPLFDEPGATFAQRLFNIGIACVYAFAALTLLDTGSKATRAVDSTC